MLATSVYVSAKDTCLEALPKDYLLLPFPPTQEEIFSNTTKSLLLISCYVLFMLGDVKCFMMANRKPFFPISR